MSSTPNLLPQPSPHHLELADSHLRPTARCLAEISAMYPRYTRWGTMRAQRRMVYSRPRPLLPRPRDQEATASPDSANEDDFYADCPFLPCDSRALRTFKLVHRHVRRRRVCVLHRADAEDVYYDAQGAYEYDWTEPEERTRPADLTADEVQCGEEVQDFEEFMAGLGAWRAEPKVQVACWRRWMS